MTTKEQSDKIAVFRAMHEDKQHIFALAKNVEAIQAMPPYKQGKQSLKASMIFFAFAGKTEIVFEEATLLSLRFFGHQNPYYPATGERYPYFFNKENVLYIRTTDNYSEFTKGGLERIQTGALIPSIITMKSGNEYTIKKHVTPLVKSLIGTNLDFRLPLNEVASQIGKPKPLKPLSNDFAQAFPDLENLQEN